MSVVEAVISKLEGDGKYLIAFDVATVPNPKDTLPRLMELIDRMGASATIVLVKGDPSKAMKIIELPDKEGEV